MSSVKGTREFATGREFAARREAAALAAPIWPGRSMSWLQSARSYAGVAVAELPATKVARRAGHGVAVLLKIYATA